MAEGWMILALVVIPVVVALITAGVGAWATLRANRRDAAKFIDLNSEQHAEGRALLTHLSNQMTGIDSKVDRLDERLDNVQQWAADHEKAHLIEDSAE